MRKLIVIAVAAALAGCWQVGPDYVKPEIDTPKQWRFADKEARDTTNLKWWEQLGDPELNRLVDQALRGNLDLKAAVATVDQFMGQYGATRSNLFPQISGFGDYLRRKNSTQSLSLPKGIELSGKDVDYARLGGQLSWEIDVWGALRRANESAFAEMLAQEGVKRGVLLTLASQVAQTYIQLRTLDKNLEITRFVVKTLEEQLQIEQARFKEGYGSELEVRQVESEYQRRLALIPAAEESIAQAEHALKLLLGQNPGAIRRGKSLDDLKLPAVPAGLPADVLVRRPDIQQAEQRLISANAQIGVARGLYFPKISITSDVGQLSTQAATMFTPGANFWSVGTSVLGPIFTAGKIAGQVQAAEAAQRAALANYQQSILTAFREFEDALVASQKTQEQRDKQGARVTAVGDYYRLSKLRYDEGLVDYITVLDSLRQLYEAQIDLLSAQSSTFTASIQLYRAMGGGWVVAEAEKLPKPQEASVFP
ncbi:efflux transporter outer membrane subunit [Methylomagnum ishizawai]|uniref:efflux transporter outer membrane subunit n=1 Tax=Methylomagnum ishizawai TaxID=1760988 RepID=UPI001C32E8A7|nr:efflux transporter outer membrane subunit [Methylomagnum ishizawai]BBL73858.1 RND transporter [Methylomagnum ishizawai]